MKHCMEERFHDKLKKKIDAYIHFVYQLTRAFPKEELYGVTSQLRRASLSVMLNYVEGYARQRDKVHVVFLETAYGSLKESIYLLEFSRAEQYLTDEELRRSLSMAEEIGAMLWKTIDHLRRK